MLRLYNNIDLNSKLEHNRPVIKIIIPKIVHIEHTNIPKLPGLDKPLIFRGIKVSETDYYIEIFTGLYVGSNPTCNLLDNLNIDIIITLGSEYSLCSTTKFRTVIDLLDNDNGNIRLICPDIINTMYNMDKAIRTNKHRIFVHCDRGISRSPSYIILYLMRTYELEFNKIMKMFLEAVNVVLIYSKFAKELRNVIIEK